MLPTTINLSDAEAIVSNLVKEEDVKAVEVTFRFIVNGNGNENGKTTSLTPDEFITLLNSARSIKHLFFVWFQHKDSLNGFTPQDKNRVNTAMNSRKKALTK